MGILEAITEAESQTYELQKKVTKIQCYVNLLNRCRGRLHTLDSNDIHRRATLKRAESRIQNRIKTLGRNLYI